MNEIPKNNEDPLWEGASPSYKKQNNLLIVKD
jgi:hypothetical protein